MTKPFQTEGPVAPERYVYVRRRADDELPKLLADGTHCCLHAGRQAGKTSLMLNLQDHFSEQGYFCLVDYLHVHMAASELSAGLQDLSDSLLEQMRCLGVHVIAPVPEREPARIVGAVLRSLVDSLPPGKRLMLMLDEFDTLMLHPPDQVARILLCLRSFCHDLETRKKLTLLIVSVRTPVEMVMDFSLGGASVNIGRDVPLSTFPNVPFTRRQIAEQAFPELPFREIEPLLEELLEFTGGQPVLTALLLSTIQSSPDRRERFAELRRECLSGGRTLVDGHLLGVRKEILDSAGELFPMMSVYRRILRGEPITASVGGRPATALENIGLVHLVDDHYRAANPIYQARLDQRWTEDIERSYETNQIGQRSTSRAPAARRSDKKLCLLLTGGTIGMLTPGGHQSTFQGAESELMRFANQYLGGIAEVQPIALIDPPRDGINMTPLEWRQIAAFLYERRDQYDGFIVAHGTDTMAFTSSAVAFMLGDAWDRPVVFTGAQTTIDVLHGDTRDNLTRACYVAAHENAIEEIQILFGDQVLRAVRAEKADDRLFQGFRSPGWPELAQVTEYLLIKDYALGGRPRPPRGTPVNYRPHLATNIMLITLIPGLQSDMYHGILKEAIREERHLDGVIIATPGVGNAPSISPYSFRPFIQEAVNGGIPVLITSQVPINPYTQNQYEMARVPEEFGAILTGNITLAAAVTKFSWVIGCVRHEIPDCDIDTRKNEIQKRMKTNFVGEQSDDLAD